MAHICLKVSTNSARLFSEEGSMRKSGSFREGFVVFSRSTEETEEEESMSMRPVLADFPKHRVTHSIL